MDANVVSVQLVPKKKGLILKHSEYEINSKKYNTSVTRRYNDFVTLNSLLMTRYPYRILPRLPPKQIMIDALLEERRRGLQRWLQIVCNHPILSTSKILETFMTDNSDKHLEHLRNICSIEPDEYSNLSNSTELPLEDQGRLASSREMMRIMLNYVTRLKKLTEQELFRVHHHGADMLEMSNVLKMINDSKRFFNEKIFDTMSSGLTALSSISSKSYKIIDSCVIEKLNLLLEVLLAHSNLCDRVEKGIVSDHQKAVSKMLHINKQKVKDVIRGSSPENVNALHQQEVTQTGIVGTLGRKSAFSLQCVLQETSLVKVYLRDLPCILLSFSHDQHRQTLESSTIWETIMKSFSENEESVSLDST